MVTTFLEWILKVKLLSKAWFLLPAFSKLVSSLWLCWQSSGTVQLLFFLSLELGGQDGSGRSWGRAGSDYDPNTFYRYLKFSKKKIITFKNHKKSKTENHKQCQNRNNQEYNKQENQEEQKLEGQNWHQIPQM